jgi:hypothetical protein
VKQIYLPLVCLFLSVAVKAEKAPRAKSLKVATEGTVQFKFNNKLAATTQRDSVLIIFDRYDHTGAGVVYQVFYADQDQNISIPEVPAGKYYVTIQCLGLHRDRLEKVITVKSQKSETVKISLQDSEEYAKGKVIIPAYKPNFANLAILKSK